MKKTIFAAPLVLTLASPAVAAPERWSIDPSHTSAQFAVKHMMISTVRGEIGGAEGFVDFEGKNPTKSKLEVSLDLATLTTRDEKRDAHLRSSDFFDAEQFPKLKFKSTKVVQKSKDRLQIIGLLTIRGITKPVTLEVEELTDSIADPWGNFRRGAHATAIVNRKDFGMVWNAALDKGGVAVSDEVKLTIDVELVRPKAADKQS